MRAHTRMHTRMHTCTCAYGVPGVLLGGLFSRHHARSSRTSPLHRRDVARRVDSVLRLGRSLLGRLRLRLRQLHLCRVVRLRRPHRRDPRPVRSPALDSLYPPGGRRLRTTAASARMSLGYTGTEPHANEAKGGATPGGHTPRTCTGHRGGHACTCTCTWSAGGHLLHGLLGCFHRGGGRHLRFYRLLLHLDTGNRLAYLAPPRTSHTATRRAAIPRLRV